jgi:uncharacterized protein
LLRPYFGNISKRLIKAPKLYFTDAGLAAYLTKWQNVETLVSGAMAGALFETFAVMELIKSYLVRGHEPPLFYYRDQQGREVDILIEQNGVIHPVEIKMTGRVTAQDVASIHFLQQQIPQAGKGAVLCAATQRLAYDRSLDVVPVSLIP